MKWWALALLLLPNCATTQSFVNAVIMKPLKCKTSIECVDCKVKCPSGIHVKGDINRRNIMIVWKTKWQSL